MRYTKYHALGNDYLVINPADMPTAPTPDAIRIICHRHYGVGSDGILYGPLDSLSAQFGLRIFNPDGSEAEKSGNGLRIFAGYLWDSGLVQTVPFTIETPGGVVRAQLQKGGRQVTVEMGRVSFSSRDIPVAGPEREVLDEGLTIRDRQFRYCAATIGNPHCVIPCDNISSELANTFGPLIEVEPRFPHRTNVQFLQVIDRHNIRIEIWERGAGYTLASGSSSSASAAVAHRLGLCDRQITVHMPGGQLEIALDEHFAVEMTGPITRVSDGSISPEIFCHPITLSF